MSIFSWFRSVFDRHSISQWPNSPSINPATGLPMAGGVDVMGNPYGTDLHQQAQHQSTYDDWHHHHSSTWHDDWSRHHDSSGHSSNWPQD